MVILAEARQPSLPSTVTRSQSPDTEMQLGKGISVRGWVHIAYLRVAGLTQSKEAVDWCSYDKKEAL